ncbi:tripartite motif containing 105 isoform X6 [Erpetoichthys calabaricus]|uniref:Nuclear factor 7, ovary-like n=1 Tax=Erpetoichthys calabaricus TaxID=27687 RepID=A0A8C4X962_ERPCA|nr:tripartite motif containing 105 isoform X4 [Erpetoichthys calabaricus]XP_051790062.1 tripartite motif containing 105 isoform X1 [Erpetoichthys calabaricus]XP_051790063.1 tripartite motif containing 105 isoform X2 [Erpetoichthys calabaricus]XP_051790064.1 tripartite motif containing 105 isoform X3 [Erpetoichthys calabaricus]XP_051790065.1 tripartite motif containing 105 isoform X5 [Erpetoichthys calabaricus]XP_051790066.1 tripartite motif containing 105 isoform X6 [Erpetoichthys calabaricus]
MNLTEDLTCAICYELFTQPVMLGCMHHFCKSCIMRFWRGSRGPVSCPQCRREFPNKQFQTNFLVAGVVEKVRGTSEETSRKKRMKHLQELLRNEQAKSKEYISMMRRDDEKINLVMRSSSELKQKVQNEFCALHQILYNEEQAVLEELRKEEDEMLNKLERHMQELKEAVRQAEEKISMIGNSLDAIKENLMVEVADLNTRSVAEVGKEPKADVPFFISKYSGPLQFAVWKKMIKLIKPGLTHLTFDPDTAHPNLILSSDQLSVVECNKKVCSTQHPRRFIQSVNVLAAQSFSSGRHYWEVHVGNKTKWDLGVAAESVDRKARVKLCPENGYLTIRLRNKNEYWAGTQPWTPLCVKHLLQRVGVFLDYEEGKVSFYNGERMELLFSFCTSFNGPIYPFFSTCFSDGGTNAEPLQLFHLQL